MDISIEAFVGFREFLRKPAFLFFGTRQGISLLPEISQERQNYPFR